MDKTLSDFLALFYKGVSPGTSIPLNGPRDPGSIDAWQLGGETPPIVYQDPLDNLISDIFGFEKDTGQLGQTDTGPSLGKAVMGEATADAPLGPGIDLGSWLQRGTVIVLGFIFVAVGLSMFKNGT